MLDIIVVNWNSGNQLSQTIASIGSYCAGLVDSIIIVDNASFDCSLDAAEKILTALPFRSTIVRNIENKGFGAACNQGAELATAELILFLNPDARLFANSLMLPINFLLQSENNNIGIVGIQLIDDSGRVARSCCRFPSIGVFIAHAIGLNHLPIFSHMTIHMSEWAHDNTRVVDHVVGAFYLMRRTLFQSLNGFDERFFVYLEDLDLSLRAQQAGYRSVFLAGAQAFHAGGGVSKQVRAHRLFYSLRSRLLYGFKHFSWWQAWILVLVTLLVEPVTRTVFSLYDSGWDGVRNTWKAYRMLFRDLGMILRNAKRA